MARFLSVFAAIVVALVFVGESQAFGRVLRNRQKNVQRIEKVVIKEKVIVEKQRVVAQPVLLLQNDYRYQRQAVVVQPVQAYYRVERFSSGYGYGAQSLSGCYSGGASSLNSSRLRALEAEVEELKIQRLQEEKQRLQVPPAR